MACSINGGNYFIYLLFHAPAANYTFLVLFILICFGSTCTRRIEFLRGFRGNYQCWIKNWRWGELGGLYPQVTPLTVVKEGPLHLSRIAFLENCVHNWQAEWTWPLGAQNGKHHGYFSLVKRKSEWRTTFFLAFCIRYTYINWSEFLIQLWFAQHQLCNILTPCWCHLGLLTQITLRNGWAWLRRSQ